MALAAFGSHLRHGGFILDDWLVVLAARHGGGFLAIGDQIARSVDRPLLGWLLAIPASLFGLAPGGYLLWTLSLAVLSALVLFLFGRGLGLDAWPAAAIAALFLLLPTTNATRLWPVTAPNNLAVALFLTGLSLAFVGLRQTGWRAAAWHTGALASYLASILIYEIAAPAVLLSLAPYTWWAGSKAALKRWYFDAAIVLGGLVFVAHHTRHDTGSPATLARNSLGIAGRAVEVAANAVLPVGPPRAVIAGVVLLVTLVAAVRWHSLDADARSGLRPWATLALAGTALVAVGYLMLVPSAYLYRPTDPGIGNRINVLSAVGYAVLAYAAVVLLVRLAGIRRSRGRYIETLAVVGLIAGYVVQDRTDARGWDAAYRGERTVIANLNREVAKPPSGATVFVFGVPLGPSPGVPIFGVWYDLRSAMDTVWRDPTVAVYPVPPDAQWSCGVTRLGPITRWTNDDSSAPYTRAYFVGLSTGRQIQIRGQASCRGQTVRFRAAPDLSLRREP